MLVATPVISLSVNVVGVHVRRPAYDLPVKASYTNFACVEPFDHSCTSFSPWALLRGLKIGKASIRCLVV